MDTDNLSISRILPEELVGLWIVIGRYYYCSGRIFLDTDFHEAYNAVTMWFRSNNTMVYYGYLNDFPTEFIYQLKDDRLLLNELCNGKIIEAPELCFNVALGSGRLELFQLGYSEWGNESLSAADMEVVGHSVLIRYEKDMNWRIEKEEEYKSAIYNGALICSLKTLERVMDRLQAVRKSQKRNTGK